MSPACWTWRARVNRLWRGSHTSSPCASPTVGQLSRSPPIASVSSAGEFVSFSKETPDAKHRRRRLGPAQAAERHAGRGRLGRACAACGHAGGDSEGMDRCLYAWASSRPPLSSCSSLSRPTVSGCAPSGITRIRIHKLWASRAATFAAASRPGSWAKLRSTSSARRLNASLADQSPSTTSLQSGVKVPRRLTVTGRVQRLLPWHWRAERPRLLSRPEGRDGQTTLAFY